MRGMKTGLAGVGLALLLASCSSNDYLNQPPPSASWAPPPPLAAPALPPPIAPTLTLDVPEALAAEPAAQRFLALKTLTEAGAISPDEAEDRRNANLGALLPYDQPPPAAGLDQPLPLAEMTGRLGQLARQPGAAAERDLLLDRLLPQAPRRRAALPPRDEAALRYDQARLSLLSQFGLVSPAEVQRERSAIAAIEQARTASPPRLLPAQPPPAKPHPVRHSRPRPAAATPAVSRPGDVPGGAIPASGKGPVGVHLLSMASPSTTDMAVAALKRDNSELAALTFKTVKTVIPDLGTTYRLLAGPVTPAEAETLCRTLRTRGQSCVVSDFDTH